MLAERLTYICKADDGVIRRVTMNYGDVDPQKGEESDRLINDLKLPVFKLDNQDLAKALDTVYGGDEIPSVDQSPDPGRAGGRQCRGCRADSQSGGIRGNTGRAGSAEERDMDTGGVVQPQASWPRHENRDSA